MAGPDEVVTGWRKSSLSSSGECVEVRMAGDGVHVRHSKDPHGGVLTFTHTEWRAFLRGVRGGEFELPASCLP